MACLCLELQLGNLVPARKERRALTQDGVAALAQSLTIFITTTCTSRTQLCAPMTDQTADCGRGATETRDCTAARHATQSSPG